MDLSYPSEAETFRKEIRGWLEENLPQGWFDEGFEMSPSEKRDFNESWVRRLHEGGWICASWPKEYGGKGLSTMENVVLAEEFARAGAPVRADFFGDTLVGPTILQWGTEEQKKTFLPQILNGTMSWCQGFSEPDAGSDLASLRRILEVRPAYVKMDIGLVQGVAIDLSRRALVAGFVHLAREAGFTLVAEGIQSEDDLETLKGLGVALGQGYLLGRPERAAFLEDQPATATGARRRVQRVRSI